MLNANINLGWHFYRNYFHGIDLSIDNLKNDETEKKFKRKNQEIVETQYNFESLKKYSRSEIIKIEVVTTYPGLLTGAGNEHEVSAKGELKLGFFFDYTTGLPVIPGSSIKGVLRSVFPQWNEKEKEFIDEIKIVKAKWIAALLDEIKKDNFNEKEFIEKTIQPKEDFENFNEIHTLEYAIFEGVKNINETKPKEKYFSIYERDIFYNAYISKAGKEGKILGTDSITPHIHEGKSYEESMLKNPTPLPFLKVLPDVQFTFQFDLKDSSRLNPEQKCILFKKILLEIGIGAKTNVGYDQFSDIGSKVEKISYNNKENPLKLDTLDVQDFNKTELTTNKKENTQDLPQYISSKLKKDSKWEAILISQDDTFNYYEFLVEKLSYQLKKRKDKNPELKLNDNVVLFFQQQYSNNNPNFKVIVNEK